MRIIIISSGYLPKIGGLEIFVASLARCFSESGQQIKVITQKYPRRLKGKEFINGIQINRYLFFDPKPPSLELRSIFAYSYALACSPFNLIRFIIYLRKFKPEIINYHFAGAPTFFLLIYLFLFRNKLIVSLHGADVEDLPFESGISMLIFKKILKKADFITANSSYKLNKAVKIAPFIKDKAKVIYNGINLKEFKNVEPYQYTKRYILSVGRLVYKKGFDVLLRAFSIVVKDIKDIVLIVAGDGTERKTLEKMVNKFNLDEWVKFYGWATALEVKKLLKGCEMLVLPSRNEPFGIVILEAMASGRPVIATRSGGPEEIIIDGQNGLLVEKENAQDLGMAILRLLGDKNLQGRIIEGAFTFVEKFQISNTAKEYLNTFEIT